MKVHILTPQGLVFEGDALRVRVPGSEGGFEVLNNHARLVSLLGIGKLIVKDPEKNDLVFAVSGGFVEVNENVVTVMAEDAVSAEKINLEQNLDEKEKAESELETLKTDTAEHRRVTTELKKITNRINIARN
ncbi:MAG: ATP synthase F1 subunit epsilon [Balneolales bacterium]